MPPDRLTAYDLDVLEELRRWRSPPASLRGRVADKAERGVEFIADHLPLKLMEHVLEFVLPRMSDLTWRGTSQPLVMRAYRRAGAEVSAIEAIAGLDLKTVDDVAGDKRMHEAGVAGVQGAAAGFFGGFLLAADVAAVMLLSMRAAQSRGLVYGFDPSDAAELAFVLTVLDAASRLGPQSKSSARAGVALLGSQMAGGGMVKHAADEVLKRLPAQLAARFGAMKSESATPILGTITSAGFNSWYLHAVTGTAQMAYRERFLERKYGTDLLSAYGL